jgi:transposase
VPGGNRTPRASRMRDARGFGMVPGTVTIQAHPCDVVTYRSLTAALRRWRHDKPEIGVWADNQIPWRTVVGLDRQSQENSAPGPAAVARPQLALDRGYDYDACRDTARAYGYVPHIPRRASKEHPLPPPTDRQRHPPRRWVVEVAHAWFNRFRALLIRWAKKAENYLALVHLAAVLIIERKLRYARSFPG